MKFPAIFVGLAIVTPLWSQPAQISDATRIHDVVASVSASRLEADITKLVSFGTRSTLSDTLSQTRGIGAARRWIKAEFERISEQCGGCLEVSYISEVFPAGRRLPDATNIVDVVAIQRGTTDPNRMIIMSGDIDGRISLNSNAIDSAPGANDNASGMSGAIEAARVLSKHRFNGSIVYMGLSGEEQGLYGGRTVARYAQEHGWNIQGVLNNDMIGNIEGLSGVIDNTHARVFSDGTVPIDMALTELAGAGLFRAVRDSGTVELSALGGHHTPFADLGYPAVRIMETNENYTRQHQDIRVEDGIHYGDVLEGVNFDYAAKLTALNAATMAALAQAPGPPTNVRISGAVQPSARMRWQPPSDSVNVTGYRVYWRLTDSPTWDFSKRVGDVTDYTFDGLINDNYFFGVVAIGSDGNESVVVFPSSGR